MSTLESRGYVATEDDIRNLAGGVIDALSSANDNRLHYLRALIGTTQHELGAPSRHRTVKGTKIRDEDVLNSHIEALEAVHAKFYGIVMKTTKEKLAGITSEGGKKGDEVNKRTNYARTAFSRANRWVRAGNDITSLVAAKVIRTALEVDGGKRRKPSPSRLATRATRQTKQLLETLRTLAAADHDAAMAGLEALMKKLVALELNGPATRDPKIAVSDNRPLRVGGTMFIPA